MVKFRKYNQFRYAGHLLFWFLSISFWLLEIYLAAEKSIDLFPETLIKAIIPNLCFASAVYINLYILIPKILKAKNYIFYGFWIILIMAFISFLIQLIFMYPLNFLFSSSNQFNHFNKDIYSAGFFVTGFYIAVTSFLKFAKDWFVLQDLNLKYAQTERQKLEAELKTLKGQINPHFLFNSLNNIYSLALSNSDKVPELILRLSDLMRHVIYESRENYIPLYRELEFVKNFIALQKIRVSEKANISFNIEGAIPDKKIAPLLFEPFIDNAFKHGLQNTEGDIFLSIEFKFEHNSQLNFKISNSYDHPINDKSKYKGIGLNNVKQRLRHLYKTNEYKLEINGDNKIFTVYLTLELKD